MSLDVVVFSTYLMLNLNFLKFPYYNSRRIYFGLVLRDIIEVNQ